MVRLNGSPFFDVVTHSITTSGIVDADSAPTFEVFEEATDATPVATGTMVKRTSKTGDYRGTYAATAANGFEVGKWYSVVVTGIVGGITAKTVAQNYQLQPAAGFGVDVLAIDGDTVAATNLRRSASSMYVGTVTGAATTVTLIDSGLTQSATDHWKGRIVTLVTGALAKQSTVITAFDPATDKLTFTALTSAPSGGDVYVVT